MLDGTLSLYKFFQIQIFEQKFEIWGFVGNEIELFLKGKNYEIFIISTKKNKDGDNSN